jgi:phosphohistidine phosphatase
MRIYLMRHAAAEESGPSGDASRPLTEGGRRDARQAGEALQERKATISVILSSPRTRARETAEIVGGILGVKVKIRERLDMGTTTAAYQDELQDDVLLVGHNPDISAFASSVVGKALSFRTATIVCIDDDQLVWSRHPSQA